VTERRQQRCVARREICQVFLELGFFLSRHILVSLLEPKRFGRAWGGLVVLLQSSQFSGVEPYDIARSALVDLEHVVALGGLFGH
jgi:hypothetical protein